MAYAACGHGQNSAKSTWSRRLTPPVAMGKTVQKAPGADGLRRLWPWANSAKSTGVDSKRRLWPCDRSGGARWLRPPPSHLPPLATPAWRAGARAPPGPGQVAPGGFGPSKPPNPSTRGRNELKGAVFEGGSGESGNRLTTDPHLIEKLFTARHTSFLRCSTT